MSTESTVITWLVFNVVGQWSLLVLLLTFFFVKHLSQRSNPFLINFLLTTFLGTIPPTLLLYTGRQSASGLPDKLCFAQAVLVDGVPPMFGAAQLVLVIDTWSEIRSFSLYKSRITSCPALKYTLILSPYVIMWTWVFASSITAIQSEATPYHGLVYWVNISVSSNAVREYVGVFMLVFGMIELAFGFSAGLLLYRSPVRVKDPAAWKRSLHFLLRIISLSFLQLIAIILCVGSRGSHHNSVKVVYELLTSMDALATFLAFGTQRTVLQAWKICKKPEPAFEFANGSLPGYTANQILERRRAEVFEEALDHGAVDGYFKPWLRVGGQHHKEPLYKDGLVASQ